LDVCCTRGPGEMKSKDRMACIDANLDDLQAGVEACGRAADVLYDDVAGVGADLKQPRNRAALKSLVQHVDQLQGWLREQKGVLRELREGISRSRHDLKGVDLSEASDHVARRNFRVRSR
jgi:hypothetical protein